LADPELNPKYPVSESQIENDLILKEIYKNKLIDIILAFFVIQTILALQMGVTIQQIEKWVVDSVQKWQN
jgi:hypothetical protein